MTATGLVLITEMFNSAIEALCDFIETNENEKLNNHLLEAGGFELAD